MKKLLSNKEKIWEIFGILFLIFLGVILRILPHPPNFAPIAAIALFGGVYLTKKYFWIVPLLALFVGDYFIGSYNIRLMIAVYGSFGIISLIGLWLRNHRSLGMIISSALVGSLLFYLITNFAVWAFSPWYMKDISGLMLSYTLALPFFKNTILGNLFYVSLFFGVYELVLNKTFLYSFFKKKSALLVSIKFDKIEE